MRGIRVLTAIAVVGWAGGIPAQDVDTDGRTAELRTRIGELEKAIQRERLRLQPEKVEAMGAGTVPTAQLAEAAASWQRGATSRDELERLGVLVDQRDGAALFKELEKILVTGEKGYAILGDFLLYLDEDRRRRIVFTADHRVRFGVAQLAMLHEIEVAGFAHFFMAATANEKPPYSRRKMYEYIPLLLQFHAGQFPDLEAMLRQDITEQLRRGPSDLNAVFAAMHALSFQPPAALLTRFLTDSSTLQEVQLVVTHLAERDDADSVRLLSGFATRELDKGSWKGGYTLRAIARLSSPWADKYLQVWIRRTGNPAAAKAAAVAYFSRPRNDSAVRPLLAYLNSSVSAGDKRAVVDALREHNVELLQILRERLDEIDLGEVRDIVNQ